jgi:RNA polymerase sigma-70 factor (ECF subfamily)
VINPLRERDAHVDVPMTESRLAESTPVAMPACARPAARERLGAAVRDNFEAVWRFLRRLGLPAADADDAAQDVMMVLANKLDEVPEGRERSFLFGTALRVAMRARRVRSLGGDGAEELLETQVDPAPGPDAMSDERRARELLDRLLAAMPIELRAVFVLAEIEQMTAAAIAVALDLPAGTAASRLRRAREDFDARLARMQAHWRFERGES